MFSRIGITLVRTMVQILKMHFYFIFLFIEKLRQLTHVVGTLSHKGIARRALPTSGGKDVDGGNRKVNKGE